MSFRRESSFHSGGPASALRQADITDLRLNEAVCGVVASPVEHLETGAANAQLTDAFNQWFEGIKGQLSEDAAGNLQNQIDAHTGDTAAHAMTGSIQLWAGQAQPTGWLLCNGQAVSRTTYANLFAVLGTAYGHTCRIYPLETDRQEGARKW